MTDKALEQEATTAAHLFYGRDATYGKEKAGYAAGYIAGRTASSNHRYEQFLHFIGRNGLRITSDGMVIKADGDGKLLPFEELILRFNEWQPAASSNLSTETIGKITEDMWQKLPLEEPSQSDIFNALVGVLPKYFPAASSTISEGQGEEKNRRDFLKHLGFRSEGTAKGGEDGLSKVMVDYYENKLESYQRIIDEQYQRIAELESTLLRCQEDFCQLVVEKGELEDKLSEGTAKSYEKNQNKNEGYTRESGEMDKSSEKNNNILGTAKGGEKEKAVRWVLEHSPFWVWAALEKQLSSQESKAIAEKAWDAGVEYEQNRYTHNKKYTQTKAEYLSQFSSPSSPVKE